MGCRAELIVLVGPSCTGKTSLSEALAEELGATILSARTVLRELGAVDDRQGLQAFGAAIDEKTSGAWLASAVARLGESERPLIVDSARTRAQIAALRRLQRDAVVVCLEASLAERERRYANRGDAADRGRSFESLIAGEPDELVEPAAEADIYVNTDRKSRDEVAAEVLREIDRRREVT